MDTREIHRLITQALSLRDANGMERSIGLLLAPHLPAMLDALDAAEARAEKAGRELEREEHDHLRTIDQRDYIHDLADRIADALGDRTEHSNANCRWRNALEFAEALTEERDAAEARAEKAESRLAEVVEYATAADAEREALKAEPARKVADVALARCEVEEKRRIDAIKNWKSMSEERDTATRPHDCPDCGAKLEWRFNGGRPAWFAVEAGRVRRAALEEAAEVARAVARKYAAPEGSGESNRPERYGALESWDAIRALATTDHAVEDTDDCLCDACLGGETCAERD